MPHASATMINRDHLPMQVAILSYGDEMPNKDIVENFARWWHDNESDELTCVCAMIDYREYLFKERR